MGEENKIDEDFNRNKISVVYHYLFYFWAIHFLRAPAFFQNQIFFRYSLSQQMVHHPSNYRIQNLEIIFHISLSNISIPFYLKFYQFYLQALFKTSCLFMCSTTTLVQVVMYSFLTLLKLYSHKKYLLGIYIVSDTVLTCFLESTFLLNYPIHCSQV